MQVDIELYRRDAQISPGLRLSVIDIAPEAPARTMVFIHGFGGKATQWRNQLLAFSDTARVIAPDLRGFARENHRQVVGVYHQLKSALARLRTGLQEGNVLALPQADHTDSDLVAIVGTADHFHHALLLVGIIPVDKQNQVLG